MPNDSLISIKEARKLLGKGGRGLSDGEVSQLIENFDSIAKLLIKHEAVLKSSVINTNK
jgi:hypothetical protein